MYKKLKSKLIWRYETQIGSLVISTVVIYFYRLGALTCGYHGNEVLVCCPQSSIQSPFISHHDVADSHFTEEVTCGQPMFNDKRKEKGPGGLGSQPWVVRVGYISKWNKYCLYIFYIYRGNMPYINWNFQSTCSKQIFKQIYILKFQDTFLTWTGIEPRTLAL